MKDFEKRPSLFGARRLSKMGDVLSRVVSKYRIGQVANRTELERAFDAVVEDELKPYIRLGSIKRGVLELHVTHPLLLQQIAGFKKTELLEKLQAEVGHLVIKDLRIKR